MVVERALHERFLSNTYLLADGDAGAGFFVDAGGPVAPLVQAAGRLGVQPTHVLLTHHHFDHVSDLGGLLERWPELRVLIHPLEIEALAASGAMPEGLQPEPLQDGEKLTFGTVEVRALLTPGHTAGMISLLAACGGGEPQGAEPGAGGFGGGEAAVFTGDTLFKGSVGGVRAPGHTTFSDLRDSIMGTLMELAPGTVVYPGHADATTVAEEWEHNPFIRIWRGLDEEGDAACTAFGEPARLVLLGEDYDGGKKAWVRWRDGKDDIVPGSRVQAG